MSRFAAFLALSIATAACGTGGGAGAGPDGDDVPFVMPETSPGADLLPATDPLGDGPRDPGVRDPGAADPGRLDGDATEVADPTDLADAEARDGVDPGPDDGGAADVARDDAGIGDPAPDEAGSDVPPPDAEDVAEVDPGTPETPADPGHEVATGACAPGDDTCWCEADEHCNPSGSVTCQPNVCDTTTGHCRRDATRMEGLHCDTGDPCTAGQTCTAGTCGGGQFLCQCKVDDDCVAPGPCVGHACVGGACKYPPQAGDCDDGDPCTVGDTCSGGTCVPGTDTCQCRKDADCDDGNQCTQDTCALDSHTCSSTVITGACEDGDPCTIGDSCHDGFCLPGLDACQCRVAGDCPDPGNPCLDRACVANKCVPAANAAACDDGHACTTGDHCSGGACVGTAICAECGDGACFQPAETCNTCPADCGACPTTETDCDNGIDDDFDGATDCADSDCAGIGRCFPGVCSRTDGALTCGNWIYYQMTGAARVTDTACGQSLGGYQLVYQFAATASQQVVFDLWDDSSGGDTGSWCIVVLGGACNPGACVPLGTHCGQPTVTVDVKAGWTYYVVVQDYYTYIDSEFDLNVICK